MQQLARNTAVLCTQHGKKTGQDGTEGQLTVRHTKQIRFNAKHRTALRTTNKGLAAAIRRNRHLLPTINKIPTRLPGPGGFR
jgi:hypothetical protein